MYPSRKSLTLATTNVASAAQRSHSAPPPMFSSRNTMKNGISATRTRVILLAVVMFCLLHYSDQFSVAGVRDLDRHEITRLQCLL